MPPSSWHWKLDPVSVDVKEKLAEVEIEGFAGCEVIDVSGAIVSFVQLQLAGVGSVPAPLIDLTEKVCGPSASEFSVVGELHAA